MDRFNEIEEFDTKLTPIFTNPIMNRFNEIEEFDTKLTPIFTNYYKKLGPILNINIEDTGYRFYFKDKELLLTLNLVTHEHDGEVISAIGKQLVTIERSYFYGRLILTLIVSDEQYEHYESIQFPRLEASLKVQSVATVTKRAYH